MKNQPKSCPSSVATEGAVLLGVVNGNGSIGYISTKIEVTAQLLEEINKTPQPEKHFRFSNRCVESGCRQWQNGNCGVIKNIMSANEGVELEPKLPNCSIRSSCRWFHQEGGKACSFCPFIITNMLKEANTEKAR